MTKTAEELKACCASAYASAAARWLLGDSFHPGGRALTSRLARALGVGPGSVVVDVASGLGSSAVQLAQETGCDVVGIEFSRENVAAATGAVAAAELDGRVCFVQGDAEALPLHDESFDGALCECSLCLFPDAPRAAGELARVLRPGARLALADVTAEPARLPAELRSVEAWVACLAHARSLDELTALVEAAGFELELTERHDEALAELLDRVEPRLRSVGIGLELFAAARAAVEEGALGYAVLVARRRG